MASSVPLPEPLARLRQPQDILVFTKADLVSKDCSNGIAVSALTGQGLPELLNCLETRAISALGRMDAPLFTRLRHQHALKACCEALQRALEHWSEAPAELLAEDLRLAARALGRITGLIDVDELLATIFGEFCIGK
jgi:tRNA modification GTPase